MNPTTTTAAASATPVATAEPDLSRRGRRVRIAVSFVVAAVILFGTIAGQDDLFPFGPFRMYATADKLNSPVADTHFEIVDTTGATIELTEVNTGIRRAEIEGQLGASGRTRRCCGSSMTPTYAESEGTVAGPGADHHPLGRPARRWDRCVHDGDHRHLDTAGSDQMRRTAAAPGKRATVVGPSPTVALTDPDSAAVQPARASSPRPLVGRRVSGWLFYAVPPGRVAAFRTVIYLFVALDPLWFTPWVRSHAAIPGVFYQPLLVGRLLHLPTPTSAARQRHLLDAHPARAGAATGRAPRLLGWMVFALYFEWMIIAMSYGKVDHDRFGLLLALAVLPTAGPARHGGPG